MDGEGKRGKERSGVREAEWGGERREGRVGGGGWVGKRGGGRGALSLLESIRSLSCQRNWHAKYAKANA